MRGRLALLLTVLWFTLTDPSHVCGAEATDDYGDPLPEFAVARLGTTRWRSNLRYGSGFATLAFAPDGITIAVGCDEGLTLFEAKTGKPVPWFAPNRKLRTAGFSQDRKTLITQSIPPDGENEKPLIQHWEVGTGKLLHQFEIECPRRRPGSYQIVSPDGRFCLAAAEGTLIVWDATTGKTIAQVKECLTYWAPIAPSRDGKLLAVMRQSESRSEPELCVFDLPAIKLRHVFRRKDDPHYALEFSPDGAWLVTGSRDSLCVWDTATGKLLREIPGISSLVRFTADGRSMACAAEKSIRLFSLPDFAEIRRFEKQPGYVRALAFSPDGRWLVSGYEHVVALWDVSTGKQVSFLPGHQAPICSLVFSADGRSLASGSQGDGTAYVWDLGTHKPRYRLGGHYYSAASVAIAPGGRTLATGDGSPRYQTGGGERHIRLWDLTDGHLVRKIPAHLNGVTSLDFAPDGKTLASGGLDARVRLWELASGTRLAQVRGDDGYHWAHFAPDGKSLLIAESSGRCALWRPDMKEKILDLRTPDGTRLTLQAPAFTSSGSQVFAHEVSRGQRAEERVRMSFWDVASGKSIRTVEKEQEHSYGHQCAIAPDGRTLATTSGRAGAIELWDIETGKRLAQLASAIPYGGSLAFSPDGKLLASGSDDTTILLWDVTAARRLHLFLDVLGDRGDAANKARKLSADPVQAVAYLRQRLANVAAAEKRLQALISALDSDDFDTREKASRELEKIAAEVETPLRLALTREASPEVRRRIQHALDGIKQAANDPAPFDINRLRLSLTVLEQFDNAEARAALAGLAELAPDSVVGRAAKAALARQRKPQIPDQPK